jgi:light-regulated signal transduction histidine kinase (bacteriophytochrome)
MRWLRVQGAPETVNDDVVSLRGAAQDITERKQREQRLEELIDRLEESNERLEQFAYAASHDLQEPLRMVSSYLQLLEDRYRDDLDEEAEEYIDFAVDGADRMRAMVDSLLDYSRVTHGNPLERTDADAVVDRVLADLHLRIEETDATVTRDDLPTVTADPDQLAQVLRNLISNALEYSGDDPPEIHIGADRGDEVWEFEVSDEGLGIDPEYQDRIFNVFEQVHTEEVASGEGGGIGLALCERILERHGGDIWVESAPGEGTTFYFTIPTEPPEDAQPVSTPNTATAEP